jgi:hypothetical protein
MGMNLWGVSPLSEDDESTMLAIVTTRQRQGQLREELSGGSPRAKRRADGQKLDTRLRSRVELAQDSEGRLSALYSKSSGGVATVHALIRGDLFHEWFDVNHAQHSNVGRDETEVSSGRSSETILDDRIAKDQRSRTGQRLLMLDDHEACDRREVSIGA